MTSPGPASSDPLAPLEAIAALLRSATAEEAFAEGARQIAAATRAPVAAVIVTRAVRWQNTAAGVRPNRSPIRSPQR